MIVLGDILRGVAKVAGDNVIIGLCTLLLVDKYNSMKHDLEQTKFGVQSNASEMNGFKTRLEGMEKSNERLVERFDNFLDRHSEKHAMKGE